MLSELQQRLTNINGIDPGFDIRDYVVTDRALAAAMSGGAMLENTNETLLVAEEKDGVALSVYLDEQTLARLANIDPLKKITDETLEDLWAVLEGISHFNYFAASALVNRQVTLLELEMQAEVDKYVATLALLLAQGETDFLARLHKRLFEAVEYRKELDDEQRRRYQTANDYAGRFCYRLREGLVTGSGRASSALRRFSRASQQGKISQVHSLAWSTAKKKTVAKSHRLIRNKLQLGI